MSEPSSPIDFETIRSAVSQVFRVGVEDMLARRNHVPHNRARHAVMYLARELTRRSIPKIGQAMNRDHTTVLYGVRKARTLLATDPEFRGAVAACRKILATLPPPEPEPEPEKIEIAPNPCPEPEIVARNVPSGRPCLMCGHPFESDGAHNRICRKCKETRAWREGQDSVTWPGAR